MKKKGWMYLHIWLYGYIGERESICDWVMFVDDDDDDGDECMEKVFGRFEE